MKLGLFVIFLSCALAQSQSDQLTAKGVQELRAGKIEEARRLLESALQADARNLNALHTLATMNFTQKKFEDARALYDRILEIDPASKEAHYGMGAIAGATAERARLDARAKSNMRPTDQGPISNVAVRKEFQEAWSEVVEDGIKNLFTALEKDPNYTPALSYLAQLIRVRADYARSPEEFLAEIRKANEYGSRNNRPSGAVTANGSSPVSVKIPEERLVKRVDPIYPSLARQYRVEGVVRFNATIDKDGKVKNLTLISGHPLFVPPATDAVKQWEFQPAATEMTGIIEVPFRLQ